MSAESDRLLTALDRKSKELLDACTACGACVAVCPTPSLAEITVESEERLAAGVLDILRNGAGPESSEAWAAACCGTGNCRTVCEHGIDPRFMLTMARRRMAARTDAREARQAGNTAFKAMSRGVRVLSRLQLPPDLLNRLSPSSRPERAESPDLIFYTGCNLLKTPHIGLLCLDVLDALGASYEVHGGPANCCGILQFRPGDDGNAGRQAHTTIDRFAAVGAGRVLSWCPTCQIQFAETLLPAEVAAQGPSFDMTMFPVYLAERLEALRPLLTHPVNKRVALYEFPGAAGVVDSVKSLLGAIEGLELVELDVAQAGYHMSSLASVPEFRRQQIAAMLRAAESAQVDALAGIFHGDHRELASHQAQWPFELVNYMELLGAAMGLAREDSFKRLKLMGDVDTILTESADLIAAHKLDPEQVRESILKDMLGDQILPADRTLHPGE